MKVKLGDICTFQSGGTPSKGTEEFFNGTIPWITTTALNGGKIDETQAVDWITEKAIEKSAAKLVPAFSIMVGTRVGVGKVAVNAVQMSTSQDIISLLNIDENWWSKDYLCKYIQGKNTFLNSQARGATIKGIKIDVLANLELEEIPLEEQVRISETIDKVKEILDARKSELLELDKLVKARFIEMFGDPIQNPKGWDMPLIEEVVANEKNALKAGPFGSALKKEYYVASGYKIYGQEQVISGDCTFGDYYIDEERYKSLENCAVQPGDVLISLVGTYGKLLIMPEVFEPGIINPRLMKITFDKEMVNPYYFKFFFQSESLKKALSENTHGGTMDILNLGIVRKIKMPLPPLKLQNEFVDFVYQADKSKVAIQKSLDETQVLFDSLMQKYFG